MRSPDAEYIRPTNDSEPSRCGAVTFQPHSCHQLTYSRCAGIRVPQLGQGCDATVSNGSLSMT